MSKDKKKHKREKNADKNKEDVRHYFDETNEMFVIDTTPNLKYLKFLRDTNTDTSEYVWKRKRKQDVSSNKTIAKSFVKPIKRSTLKCSDNSQRKRHCGNWNPSPTKLNIRYSNKLRREAEETQKNTDENIGTNSKYKLREIIVDGCNVAMKYDTFFLIIYIIDMLLMNFDKMQRLANCIQDILGLNCQT